MRFIGFVLWSWRAKPRKKTIWVRLVVLFPVCRRFPASLTDLVDHDHVLVFSFLALLRTCVVEPRFQPELLPMLLQQLPAGGDEDEEELFTQCSWILLNSTCSFCLPILPMSSFFVCRLFWRGNPHVMGVESRNVPQLFLIFGSAYGTECSCEALDNRISSFVLKISRAVPPSTFQQLLSSLSSRQQQRVRKILDQHPATSWFGWFLRRTMTSTIFIVSRALD